MKIKRILAVLLIFSLCLGTVNKVSAKTKYTYAQKQLAETLAGYQSDLMDPDAFKIRHIYKVNYVLKEKYREYYRKLGLTQLNIKWEVEISGTNAFGGTVRQTIYISSGYTPYDEDEIDFHEYTDKTDPFKMFKSSAWIKKVKKLTKIYYKRYFK